MNWRREGRDLWTAGPLTVYRELDARSNTYLFELYSTTRFVAAYATLPEAMQRAEQLGWAVAV